MIKILLITSVFQLFLTIFIIALSKKLNLLDLPDKRKLHLKPTPYAGGLVISITYLLVVFLTEFENNYLNLILTISFVTALFGFLDDFFKINPGAKLILQILPIFFLVNNGLFLLDLGNYNFFGIINLGSFAQVFTILACLLLVNASNYSDGIDGLLPLIVIFVLLIFFIYLSLQNNPYEGLFLIYLIIPLMVFLLFNFEIIKNFKIFLGDSGSNHLGYIISFLSIYLYKYHNLHPSIIIWPLAYLVFEFLTVNILRLITDKKIFKAGHDHLHYLLKKKYKTKLYSTLIIIILINIFFSIFGLLINKFFSHDISIILYLLSFLIYFRIRLVTFKSI
jgi:UDP-GlcNAc:undecaprenyl-phosphate GlcNAc-1-phosphate transferase